MNQFTVLVKFAGILVCTLSVVSVQGSRREYFGESPCSIVPDVVHRVGSYRGLCITYEGDAEVQLCNRLEVNQTRHQPNVSYCSNPARLWTFLIVDADFPGVDALKQVLEWLVVNIPGDDVASGQTVMSYRGPVPGNGGPHRYMCLLFPQEDRITIELQDRFISVKEFAKSYNLGPPIAKVFLLRIPQ